jgi:hypothetical protein
VGDRARRIAKWIVRTGIAIVVLIGAYLSVFFLPYPLFPHHLEHAGFSVYSDREIPPDFVPILDEARVRLETMELYCGDNPPRIFVCRSQRLFDFINRWAGKRHSGQGLLISLAGNAFFSGPRIAEVADRHGDGLTRSRLAGSWPAAICHETAHHLVFKHLGLFGIRGLPVWKAEGYADSQANLPPAALDSEDDLRARIALVLDDASWIGPTATIDRRHFRWQTLVEFLATVRGVTFDRLRDPELTEELAMADMTAWYLGACSAKISGVFQVP